MVSLSAPQLLSGYDQGHGILAAGGDISPTERAIADKLSDLSGYLPLDTTFASYWTGYPCGRYYAFACTWPDEKAIRGGTVLTHTLLLPRDSLGEISDLQSLAASFRKPDSAADRIPYTTPLPIQLSTEPGPPVVDDASKAVAALWFGQQDRPLFWLDQSDGGDATEVVQSLWRLLPTLTRADFAFCTFALGVRRIERRPFDFLALPPSARASFLEWTKTTSWYERGRLRDPGVRHFAADPWTADLIAHGATFFDPVFDLCGTQNLPIPAPWLLRDALRFVRLENTKEASALTIARTRADLLFWLWPSLAPTHPLAREVLAALLKELPTAPAKPRPFRDIREFLFRDPVGLLAAEDEAFRNDASVAVQSEIEKRLRESPATDGEYLTLLEESGDTFHAAVVRGTLESQAIAKAPSANAAVAAALLRIATLEKQGTYVQATLAQLPAELRVECVRSAMAKLDEHERTWLAENVATAATALLDLDLLFSQDEPDGPQNKLGRALHIVKNTGAKPVALLQKIPHHEVLRWALASTTDLPIADGLGEDSARALKLDSESLAIRCVDAIQENLAVLPAAARVFVRFSSSASVERFKKALEGRAVLAEQIVRWTIREGMPCSTRFRDAITSMPEGNPCTEAILAELEAPVVSSWARDVAENLVPFVLKALHQQTLIADQAGRWLALGDMRLFIDRAKEWQIFERVPSSRRGSLLPVLAQAVGASFAHRSSPTAWVVNLLAPALEASTSANLDEASEPLANLLDVGLEPKTRFALALVTLDRVRTLHAQNTAALVERAFPVIYPTLVQGRKSDLPWPFRLWLPADDWDQAKPARKWLLDTWMEMNWPPAGFLRALGNDHDLFRRMVSRMAKKHDGIAFLQRLQKATDDDASLANEWGTAIARALSNPHAPVDYE